MALPGCTRWMRREQLYWKKGNNQSSKGGCKGLQFTEQPIYHTFLRIYLTIGQWYCKCCWQWGPWTLCWNSLLPYKNICNPWVIGTPYIVQMFQRVHFGTFSLQWCLLVSKKFWWVHLYSLPWFRSCFWDYRRDSLLPFKAIHVPEVWKAEFHNRNGFCPSSRMYWSRDRHFFL